MSRLDVRIRAKLRLIFQRSLLAADVWQHGLPGNRPLQNGRMAVRDRFADLRQYITTDSPLIIDGGAHLGGSILRFLSDYPSIIHSEPNLNRGLNYRLDLARIPALSFMLKHSVGGNQNHSLQNLKA
jgi:hypothetical protein